MDTYAAPKPAIATPTGPKIANKLDPPLLAASTPVARSPIARTAAPACGLTTDNDVARPPIMLAVSPALSFTLSRLLENALLLLAAVFAVLPVPSTVFVRPSKPLRVLFVVP